MPGIIAIVGRPNVGKSALFNRIAGRRIAIVHDQPGVTRDRVSAEVEWHGRPFTIIDTGGIGLLRGESSPDIISKAALEQVLLAIDTADAIIHVVDIQQGVVPLDREVSLRIRTSGKPVLLAANKADTYKAEVDQDDFSQLGHDQIYMVSAIHGHGIGDLVESALEFLPKPAALPPESTPDSQDSPTDTDAKADPSDTPTALKSNLLQDPLKLAIVGRPNVGKSSIINALTNSERVIVSPIPGTTRDSVDVPFEVDTEGVRQRFLLIDTAGMRKSRRVDDPVEFFSVKRAEDSILRSDVVVLVLDAEVGITEQDKKIADKIVEARKACVIVINKWDLVEEDVRLAREKEVERRNAKITHRDSRAKRLTTLSEFGDWVQRHLFFLSYAPVLFTSAKSGFHLDRLLESVRYVAAQLRQQVPTAILNRVLADAIEKRQPVSDAGHVLKFFYATQVSQAPPVFLLFVNRDEILSETYEKYLAGEMRTAFGYEGCPILIRAQPRPKTIESHRERQHKAAAARPHRTRVGGSAGRVKPKGSGRGAKTAPRKKGRP